MLGADSMCWLHAPKQRKHSKYLDQDAGCETEIQQQKRLGKKKGEKKKKREEKEKENRRKEEKGKCTERALWTRNCLFVWLTHFVEQMILSP